MFRWQTPSRESPLHLTPSQVAMASAESVIGDCTDADNSPYTRSRMRVEAERCANQTVSHLFQSSLDMENSNAGSNLNLQPSTICFEAAGSVEESSIDIPVSLSSSESF